MPSSYNENQVKLACAAPVEPEEVMPHAGRFKLSPFGILLSEWTLCNIGHYCMLAILSLYLVVTLHLTVSIAALLLLFASLAFRLARFFTAPLIDHLSTRPALLISITLGCLGYIGMTVITQPLLLVLLFLLIGIGYGSNALIVKVLAAKGRGASKLLRYASINMGLNVGAAIGPIVGNTLFLHWNPHLLFLFPAGMFALAGLISMMFPSMEAQATEQVSWIKMLGNALQFSIVRQNMLFVFVAFFLYSQLFATLPLVTRSLFHTPELLSSFFALNALIIVLGQVPATRLLILLGLPLRQLLHVSFLMYTAGFILIWLLPYWQIAYPAMVLWTTGEMLIFPSLDTLMATEIPFELGMACFSLSTVAVAFGEGIGSLLGVWVVGYLTPLNQIRQLYVLFAIIAAVGFAGSLLIGRGSSLRDHPEQVQR